MATVGGDTAIMGWIEGTTWLTLPMSVLPTIVWSAAGSTRSRPVRARFAR
jgi:hypothetical protein